MTLMVALWDLFGLTGALGAGLIALACIDRLRAA